MFVRLTNKNGEPISINVNKIVYVQPGVTDYGCPSGSTVATDGNQWLHVREEQDVVIAKIWAAHTGVCADTPMKLPVPDATWHQFPVSIDSVDCSKPLP